MNSEQSKTDRFFEKARTNVESARFLLGLDDADGTINRAYYAMLQGRLGCLRLEQGSGGFLSVAGRGMPGDVRPYRLFKPAMDNLLKKEGII